MDLSPARTEEHNRVRWLRKKQLMVDYSHSHPLPCDPTRVTLSNTSRVFSGCEKKQPILRAVVLCNICSPNVNPGGTGVLAMHATARRLFFSQPPDPWSVVVPGRKVTIRRDRQPDWLRACGCKGQWVNKSDEGTNGCFGRSWAQKFVNAQV